MKDKISFIKKMLLVSAFTLFSSLSLAGNIVIDDFSSDDEVNDSSLGAGTCVAGDMVDNGCFSSSLGSMLGNERDIFVDLANREFGANNANINVAAGSLSFNVGAGTKASASVTYDGVDGSHDVNTTGLGGFDLTMEGSNLGFMFHVLFSDADFNFDINVWDEQGVMTTASFSSLGVDEPSTRYINFSDSAFNGFDFTSLGALQFVIDPQAGFTALDLALNSIEAVPEPSILLIFSLGLIGLGLRRKSLMNKS